MSGVFLSYSRADHAIAAQIIHGLRAVGVTVWWDEDMRGVDWQEELERQIGELAAVVLLWTPNSSNSKHVRDEARLGLETDKLINAIEGLQKPPFPYDRVNALPLDGWTWREPHRGWTRLVETVEEKIVACGGVTPGEITQALARREKDVRQKQHAILRATEAFQAAQTRDGETARALEEAATAFDRAEAQHQSVVDLRASPAVQRAARQELDGAQTAKEEANRALRAAKAELAETSRAVTRAEAALERLFSDLGAPQTRAAPRPRSAAEPEPSVKPMAPHQAAHGPRAAAAQPFWLSWIAAGGAAAVVLAGVTIFTHRPSVAAQPVSAHPAAIAEPTGARNSSSRAAAAEAAIAGKWTLQNVSCAYAIDFHAQGGALSIGGAAVKIASVDPDGVIRTDGRDAYSVAGDTLTMTSPNGDRTSYTRCAA